MPGDGPGTQAERCTPRGLSQIAGKQDYRAGNAPWAIVLV
jgi:hypothetical protein